jgi:hypothetical protein
VGAWLKADLEYWDQQSLSFRTDELVRKESKDV